MKFKTWSRSSKPSAPEEEVQVVAAQAVKQQRQISSYKKKKKSKINVNPLDITYHGSTDNDGVNNDDGRDSDSGSSNNSCSSFSSDTLTQSHNNIIKRRATYSGGDTRKDDNQKTEQEIPQTVLSAASTNTRRSNTNTNRRGQMRSKSLSRRDLMAQSCACFAPLPDYAKYKERKIQRELSRTCIFTSEPSSPLQINESRESNKQMVRSKSLDLSDAIARHASSPSVQEEAATPTTETSASSPAESGGNSRASSRGLYQQSTQEKEEMMSSINPPQLEFIDTPQPKNHDAQLSSVPQTKPPPTLLGKKQENRSESPQMLIQVEISPGTTMVLRNVEETMMAIRNDFFVPVACLGCSLDDMVCIADAEYVLCPTCRVVSPILVMGRQRDPNDQPQKGLGLGVRYESLLAIQSEILAADRVNR